MDASQVKRDVRFPFMGQFARKVWKFSVSYCVKYVVIKKIDLNMKKTMLLFYNLNYQTYERTDLESKGFAIIDLATSDRLIRN
jgi:hypothetical protein